SCSISGVPCTATLTPFDASGAAPEGLEITQENKFCPDIRFAARKGSRAEAKASMEKLGTSKKPTVSGPALLLA
ncbi:MAG: hypothetical protein ACPHVQ_05620, partial [Candidatus Puniceispirillaceae bacterium]